MSPVAPLSPGAPVDLDAGAGGARRRRSSLANALTVLAGAAVFIAALVTWLHDRYESRRPMIVFTAKEGAHRDLAGAVEREVRAQLQRLGEPASRDDRWFPALGSRAGLTLTGSLTSVDSKVRIDLTVSHAGSVPQSAPLLFTRELLEKHISVIGEPVLSAVHVNSATGLPIPANDIDPEEGDALLLAAAGVALPPPSPTAPASVPASASASNQLSPVSRPTAETPSAGDPRPTLFIVKMLEALKPSQTSSVSPSAWLDVAVGGDRATRVRAAFFDARRFTVRALLSEDEHGSHARVVVPPDGTVFLVNGAEFHETPRGAPDAVRVSAGLVYSKGVLLSDADLAYGLGTKNLGGLFAIEAQADGAVRTILLPRTATGSRIDFQALDRPSELLQAKWALIHPNSGPLPCKSATMPAESGGLEGICRHAQKYPYARSAFCMRDSEFGFVMVTGRQGLSLYQFMKLLAAPRAAGGFACQMALNLDGADTIQFRYWGHPRPSNNAPLHDHRGDRPAANFLAVVPR